MAMYIGVIGDGDCSIRGSGRGSFPSGSRFSIEVVDPGRIRSIGIIAEQLAIVFPPALLWSFALSHEEGKTLSSPLGQSIRSPMDVILADTSIIFFSLFLSSLLSIPFPFHIIIDLSEMEEGEKKLV